jgi:hypothetical protein
MDTDSPAAITAQALKFLGLLVTAGGALAILRTGERNLLYVCMMPLGLVMWGAGFWLLGRQARSTSSHPPDKDADHG